MTESSPSSAHRRERLVGQSGRLMTGKHGADAFSCRWFLCSNGRKFQSASIVTSFRGEYADEISGIRRGAIASMKLPSLLKSCEKVEPDRLIGKNVTNVTQIPPKSKIKLGHMLFFFIQKLIAPTGCAMPTLSEHRRGQGQYFFKIIFLFFCSIRSLCPSGCHKWTVLLTLKD